ncbi:TOBE domain-containing protein [Methyloligella sp. 2.7D]|nr:TOBE domain-containing protein [Methyloligella sp. GL2]
MLRPEELSRAAGDGPALAFPGRVSARYYTGKDYQLELASETFGALQASLRDDGAVPAIGEAVTLYSSLQNLHVIDEVVA